MFQFFYRSTTKRKGWVNHDIKGPESIADHMYRMAIMALIVGDLPGINRERCIKIALVHDIAEAIVGDITPSDGVPKVEKTRLEQAALNEMCNILGGGMRAAEIQELWREYEDNASLEANLVKDFDKVEMILQALEYETGKQLELVITSLPLTSCEFLLDKNAIPIKLKISMRVHMHTHGIYLLVPKED
ncbi:putative HD/PDEase domain, 5'-deoxynucleotidase YfbR/HDDC2 [Helianthus anomalus]